MKAISLKKDGEKTWSCTRIRTRIGAPVAQWVKRWPADLADRVRSSLEVKSSQPKRSSIAHSLSLSSEHRSDMTEILLKRT